MAGERALEGVEVVEGQEGQALGAEEELILEDGAVGNVRGDAVRGRVPGDEGAGGAEVESAGGAGEGRCEEPVCPGAQGRGVDQADARVRGPGGTPGRAGGGGI